MNLEQLTENVANDPRTTDLALLAAEQLRHGEEVRFVTHVEGLFRVSTVHIAFGMRKGCFETLVFVGKKGLREVGPCGVGANLSEAVAEHLRVLSLVRRRQQMQVTDRQARLILKRELTESDAILGECA